MCIAVVKPRDIGIPDMKILENCFDNNQDGAGFSYSNGKSFHTIKGLMTFKAFKLALENVISEVGNDGLKSRIMAFHFRIGTHGSSRDPKHTHPFPLSSEISRLEALDVKSRYICMHNGILSRWGTPMYGASKERLSDTMDFIKSFIAPLQRMSAPNTIYDILDAQSLISKEVSGSRFAILEPNGRWIRWGNWVKDANGVYYSNDGYTYSQASSYSYHGSQTDTKYYQRWYGYNDDYVEVPPKLPPDPSDFIKLSYKPADAEALKKSAYERHLYPMLGMWNLDVVSDSAGKEASNPIELNCKEDDALFVNWYTKGVYQYDGDRSFDLVLTCKSISKKKVQEAKA